MKRDIKFRALKDDMSDCRFVYGQLTYGIDPITVTFYPRIHEVIGQPFSTSCLPNTEGQFTGLCDKNGVEIYEGDIVSHLHSADTCVVVFQKESAMFLSQEIQDEELAFGIEDVIEVIGNIYQNKELLK